MLRYCLPRVRNRGHGLGNELIPWARAFLASQILDARLLPPAFGLNRRGYWQHFRTSPDDWIYHRALQSLLPVIEFNESDYLAHGGGNVVQALRSFADANDLHRRRVFALVTDGLWGGYSHVQSARQFMQATLYQSRYAARNLLRLQQRIDPNKVLVGMHVRLGDFAAPAALADYQRSPNTSLPLEWFVNVADCLQQAFDDDWQLLLVSDGGPDELQALLSRHRCIITGDIPNGDCSDALALSQADLLVCSASSYSSLAATLSDSPYIWFAGNLHEHPEGCYSLHGGYTTSHDQQENARRQTSKEHQRSGDDTTHAPVTQQQNQEEERQHDTTGNLTRQPTLPLSQDTTAEATPEHDTLTTRVLEYLAQHDNAKQMEIAQSLGITVRTVQRKLTALKRQ